MPKNNTKFPTWLIVWMVSSIALLGGLHYFYNQYVAKLERRNALPTVDASVLTTLPNNKTFDVVSSTGVQFDDKASITIGGLPIYEWIVPPQYVEIDSATLNMANTVDPLLQRLAKEKCGPKRAGQLIYKREKTRHYKNDAGESFCGGPYESDLYMRCYESWWEHTETTTTLFYKPIEDVDLEAHLCIPEGDIEIPYPDKQLQDAPLGQTYIHQEDRRMSQ